MSTEELKNTIELLKLELECEKQEFLQSLEKPLDERIKEGTTLFPLVLEEENYSSSGKLLLTFRLSEKSEQEIHFRQGDVVSIFRNVEPIVRITGTISKIKNSEEMEVSLNMEELPEDFDEGKIGIDKFLDEYTYSEMFSAMQKVMDAKSSRLAELRDVILKKKSPYFFKDAPKYKSEKLNESQVRAVNEILSCRDFCIIQGPPGTGKTLTLTSAIEEILKYEKQVLVTASSNAAVDLLAEKLAEKNIKVTRIGNPIRVSEAVQSNTLDYKLHNHPDYSIVKKNKLEASKIKKEALKYKRKFTSKEREERKTLIKESKDVLNYARETEKTLIQSILDESKVICTTLVGSNDIVLANRNFSTVIIDEATQCLEPANWIPICKANRLIMAGDEHQLPPTVKSLEASQKGLSITLFEKLLDVGANCFLDTQYRMNESIMAYSNQYFYSNQLKAHPNTRQHTIEHITQEKLTTFDTPLLFIDTAGCDYLEEESSYTESTYNPLEADLTIRLIQKLEEELSYYNSIHLDCGLITPYRAQVDYFKENLKKASFQTLDLEIDTIDSFQGREKEIIIISLVRSNDDFNIGFLSDLRRMNVAMTRAKRFLMIVGDSSTISTNDFYSELVDYCHHSNFYKSAWEFID